MPLIRVSHELTKWEHRLRAEGLAPVDQRIGARVFVRTEIITPKRQYLPEPERLAMALELWLAGDRTGFTRHGLQILAGAPHGGQSGPRWPRRRARILLRICEAMSAGMSIGEAITRPGDQNLAYGYLRGLYRELLGNDSPLVDDDSDDDGTSGD